MEEVVEEKNEEQVDSFGRLMVRKVAVLEKKRRSKNIEGLLGRERNRRKRINNWCCKLGLPVFLEEHEDHIELSFFEVIPPKNKKIKILIKVNKVHRSYY